MKKTLKVTSDMMKPQRQCEHGRRQTRCKSCKGGSICIHKKLRYRCEHCSIEWASSKRKDGNAGAAANIDSILAWGEAAVTIQSVLSESRSKFASPYTDSTLFGPIPIVWQADKYLPATPAAAATAVADARVSPLAATMATDALQLHANVEPGTTSGQPVQVVVVKSDASPTPGSRVSCPPYAPAPAPVDPVGTATATGQPLELLVVKSDASPTLGSRVSCPPYAPAPAPVGPVGTATATGQPLELPVASSDASPTPGSRVSCYPYAPAFVSTSPVAAWNSQSTPGLAAWMPSQMPWMPYMMTWMPNQIPTEPLHPYLQNGVPPISPPLSPPAADTKSSSSTHATVRAEQPWQGAMRLYRYLSGSFLIGCVALLAMCASSPMEPAGSRSRGAQRSNLTTEIQIDSLLPPAVDLGCPEGWFAGPVGRAGTGRCFSAKNTFASHAECVAMCSVGQPKATLACIESQEENDFILAALSARGDILVGAPWRLAVARSPIFTACSAC
jgi:hypothetical protein